MESYDVLLKCVYKRCNCLTESYVKPIVIQNNIVSYLACDEKGKCFETYGVYSSDKVGFLNQYEYVAPTWEVMNDMIKDIDNLTKGN